MVKPKEPIEVGIEIDERFFQVTVPLREESLIEDVLNGLAESVQKGSSLKIRQAHKSSPSDSQHMLLKVVSNRNQMESWLAESKILRCVVCADRE